MIKEQLSNIEMAFLLFTDKENNRSLEYNQPFYQNGRFIATDGTALIYMQTPNGLKLNYIEKDKPQIDAVIPKKQNP